MQENTPPKNLRFDLYIGAWKKASDTAVTLLFPSNANMNGTFVISKLTENELKLKKSLQRRDRKKTGFYTQDKRYFLLKSTIS